jgi:hypothetical protein
MKLEIKLHSLPKCAVEADLESNESPIEVMANFYTIKRIREEALQKIKAELHRFADQLTVEDLNVT